MAEGTMNGKAGMVGVYLLSLLAILLWGMSYLWSDSLLALGIPVEYIVFARISIAGVVLLVFNLATGQNIRMQKKHVLRLRNLRYPLHGVADHQLSLDCCRPDFLRYCRNGDFQ